MNRIISSYKICLFHVLLYAVLMFFFTFKITAQTGGAAINSTGANPDPSAILDVSSDSKGILIPRLSESERNGILNPAFGLLILNTSTGCFNVWLGSNWKQICGECDFQSPMASSNSPVCENSILNLYATYIPGAVYSWTGPNGFNSSSQNPVINNVGLSAAGMYSVTATLNSCTSQEQNIYVSINPKPSGPIASNNGPVCLSGTANLSSSAAQGVIYNWSGPGGFSSNMQNILINNVQFSDSGLYSLFVTANSCNSDTTFTSLSVLTVPNQPSSISGTVSPCEGSSGNVYSVVNVIDVSYNWSVPLGWLITSGQGSSSITVTVGSVAGDVSVIPSNNCGDGDAVSLAVAPVPIAAGGTITLIPGYRIHTFTGNGQFVLNSACSSVDVEVLVVGGGGGGGHNHSGGGGAGGLISNNSYSLVAGQTINVVVGSGGAGGTSSTYQGSNGNNSIFGTLTAYGGGGGGSRHDGYAPGEGNGAAGGSGGGGGGRDASNADYLGGSGTALQGSSGGNGFRDTYPSSGGGGGGAGGSGTNASSYKGGNGGPGALINITGTNVYYAGGGGGGAYGPNGGIAGNGGVGGGGNGSVTNGKASDGTVNTGGGGGGSGSGGFGGDGGSGIVIVRYPIP